jgi:hypothetical protein
MKIRNRFLSSMILFAFCMAGSLSTGMAQEPVAKPSNTSTSQRVFVFVQRTDRHAKYSSQEMFHDAMQAVMDYLNQKKVAIAVDEFGGRNHAEGAMPMETIFKIAKDANADGVLWVEVDRPKTKWLKLTIKCFDMNNTLLWEEKAESGGGFSGAHGLEVASKRMQEALDKHVGQTGLPVLADNTESSPAEAK